MLLYEVDVSMKIRCRSHKAEDAIEEGHVLCIMYVCIMYYVRMYYGCDRGRTSELSCAPLHSIETR